MFKIILSLLFCLITTNVFAVGYIKGTVSQTQADLQPQVNIERKKIEVTTAENVALYVIETDATITRSNLYRFFVGTRRQVNGYDISRKNGEYRIPVTPGKTYTVVAIIGYELEYFAVSRPMKVNDEEEIVIDFNIDKTTH